MSLRILIMDACMAITFGNAGRIDLLHGISNTRTVIGARGRKEVARPPASEALQTAMNAGSIELEQVDLNNIDEQDALARFDSRPAFRDTGEAEVLALGKTRGYIVGSDERAVTTAAAAEGGKYATSLDILIWAVRQKRLSVTEAEYILGTLDVGAGIIKRMTAQNVKLSDLV